MTGRGLALLAYVLVSAPIGAIGDDAKVRLIAHPSRAGAVSEADARAIYLKQKLFWDDGSTIVPINREAGSAVREAFSQRLLGQGSRRLAAFWNRRYFEDGQFPPATMASEEAMVRFVAGNRDAIGYVSGSDLDDEVAVVLTIDVDLDGGEDP